MTVYRQFLTFAISRLIGALASAPPASAQDQNPTAAVKRSLESSNQIPPEHPPGHQGMVKAGEGYFSPDGSTIIYPGGAARTIRFYQIYTQPLDQAASRTADQHRPRPHDLRLFLARRQAHHVRLEPSRPASVRHGGSSTQAARRRQKIRHSAALQVGLRSAHGHFLRPISTGKILAN